MQTWKEWRNRSELCPNNLEVLPLLVSSELLHSYYMALVPLQIDSSFKLQYCIQIFLIKKEKCCTAFRIEMRVDWVRLPSLMRDIFFFHQSAGDTEVSIVAQNKDCYESGIVCMKMLLIHVGLTKIFFTDNSGNPVCIHTLTLFLLIWQFAFPSVPFKNVKTQWCLFMQSNIVFPASEPLHCCRTGLRVWALESRLLHCGTLPLSWTDHPLGPQDNCAHQSWTSVEGLDQE